MLCWPNGVEFPLTPPSEDCTPKGVAADWPNVAVFCPNVFVTGVAIPYFFSSFRINSCSCPLYFSSNFGIS